MHPRRLGEPLETLAVVGKPLGNHQNLLASKEAAAKNSSPLTEEAPEEKKLVFDLTQVVLS